MSQNTQTIQMSYHGVLHEATVSWWPAEWPCWVVAITSAEFDRVERRADDAFEALCLVRAELEPRGWRIGVAGALANVWPSGMARDQGGGQRAYRLSIRGAEELVHTFGPVDPSTVVTLAEQRAETDRLFALARAAAMP